ncbi:MAG: hypothetical protein EPN26_02160 [Rhodospirillales bacterium]|nr:MAG: hypothetical protein EPN26_02160 [Rhodospirillales bacterium]
MTYNRYAPASHGDPLVQPFDSAEAAWFWYCQSQIARYEGARFNSRDGAGLPRPCDPDDVFTTVDRMYRARELDRKHLVVLGEYGLRLRPPVPQHVHEREAARVWSEALARLAPVLQAKGIVL